MCLTAAVSVGSEAVIAADRARWSEDGAGHVEHADPLPKLHRAERGAWTYSGPVALYHAGLQVLRGADLTDLTDVRDRLETAVAGASHLDGPWPWSFTVAAARDGLARVYGFGGDGLRLFAPPEFSMTGPTLDVDDPDATMQGWKAALAQVAGSGNLEAAERTVRAIHREAADVSRYVSSDFDLLTVGG